MIVSKISSHPKELNGRQSKICTVEMMVRSRATRNMAMKTETSGIHVFAAVAGGAGLLFAGSLATDGGDCSLS